MVRRWSGRWAACLLATWPAAVAGGQTAPGNAAGGPTVATSFDIRRVVPDSFRAAAVRLPEGRAPRIDGRLDDEVWALAPANGNFIQRDPHFGAPASERTEFRILYDDRKIYFGVWVFDSRPDGIIASELKRDALLRKGDRIKINIDTFHDHRNAYYFATNPLGALKDAHSIDNGRTINYEWNAVWENETSRDERGWYVEAAIPFSQLRFGGGTGDVIWGLNVCRILGRKNEDSYWVPYPREWGQTGFARMTQAGVIVGLRDLLPRRRVEVVPFLTPRASRDYDNATTAATKTAYGVDARIGLTSNLLADLTYRTDFAQVEADEEVVNLTRFSLFFPEKRQFFTESAGAFDYGRGGRGLVGGGGAPEAPTPGLLTLFHSRTIGLRDGRQVPLIGGAKVTGRAGPYTVGMLNVTTDAVQPGVGIGPGVQIGRANYTAFRVKRDVLAKSSIGAIVLDREGGPGSAYNRTAGLDAGLALGQNTVLTLLLAKTFSPGIRRRDAAGVVDFIWKTDRFDTGLTYQDVGEGFNAEMGFIARTDIRNSRGRAAWTPRPGWRGVRQLVFGAGADYFENHAGRTESRNEGLDFSLQFQDSSSIKASADRDYDLLPSDWNVGAGRLAQGGYTWDTYQAGFTGNQSRPWYLDASIQWGGYYSGDKQTFRVGFNLVPVDTLLVESSYTRNHVLLPGNPRFVTNTLSTRVSYSFSPDLFLKAFVQYNDERRLASSNILLWYIYRPGSDFYVVYNEGWETGFPGPRLVHVRNRSLSLKITYWLAR